MGSSDVKPLLLIDVDGVLNRYPMLRDLNHAQPGSTVYRLHPRGFERQGLNVLLNESDGQELNKLADVTQLTWATSWEHEANDMIGPRIGLPPLPVIELTRYRTPMRGIWKRPSVELYAQDAPLAWIDDDFEFEDFTWARRRTRSGRPTLLVPCKADIGVTSDDFASIREWAERISSE